MFDGGILIGEVFKHISRDIWVQVKQVVTDRPASLVGLGKTYHHNWVEFDILVYDKPESTEDDVDGHQPSPFLGLREFCCLFTSCGV